jgi:ribosomal protein L11 methyltransferase
VSGLTRYPALDLQYAATSGPGALEDLIYAELDAFEPLAIHEQDDDGGWRVFFRTAALRDAAHGALVSALGDRLRLISPIDVDDEDWARRSQAALTRVQVGRFIIAPPWDVPSDRGSGSGARDSKVASRDPDEIVIVIEPSMGFGTGHHATTRLCLELLQEIDVRGKRVIDVGTGSGVLALAAWRLGASSVTAIDHDPDALQSARENFARNEGTGAIEIIQADLSALSIERADVVLANLTGAVLQRYAPALRRMVADAGTLVVSGFSPEELDDVVEALGGVARRSVHDGDWAAVALEFRFDR